ncbi:MAG TPA: hypothetical protein DEG13_01315 [Candidatus Microthrix parvicella]|jgi:hypothetical protein|nr:hypothetical protein [Candidatus Microthrix parvicella]
MLVTPTKQLTPVALPPMKHTTTSEPMHSGRLIKLALLIVGMTVLAGCGNDLSAGEQPTPSTSPERTTEATGASSPPTTQPPADETPATPETTEDTGSGGTTGITLPDGTEITLPEGVELTVPKNVGSCVEASTALGKLNLSLLGATSTADIDDSAAQLKEVLGTDAAKDVDEVANAARKAAESGTISPGAYNDDAYNAANAALAKRITTLCSEG